MDSKYQEETHPFRNFMGVAYNTIREWNFEEWRYMGGIVIEKMVGKV
jgi:hypothetical protein